MGDEEHVTPSLKRKLPERKATVVKFDEEMSEEVEVENGDGEEEADVFWS